MSHHGHSCEGDHDHHDVPERGIQYSLYQKIDIDNVKCLNEVTDGSGKTVFKPWEDRLNFNTFVESDADEELLFNIPFTGNVKLKGIIIIGGNLDSHPSKMRIFKNRPSMAFDDVAIPADQEFELQQDSDGSIEYATKIVTFSSVHHLTLHFPSNFGADATRIFYIGMKGDFFQRKEHGVTICTYETRPMMPDIKNPLVKENNYEIH